MTAQENQIQVSLPREIFSPIALNSLCRLGSAGDGGYLVPETVVEFSQGLISLGVADNWDFEKNFALINPNAPLNSYDYSVGSLRTLTRFIKKLFRSIFGNESIYSALGEILILFRMRFFFRGNRKFIQKRVVRTVTEPRDIAISEVFDLLPFNHLIFKCDIEGFEYEILDEILTKANQITLIVIEFHDINLHYEELVNFISKIRESHELVHLHANNYNSSLGFRGIPEVLELTFSQGKSNAGFPKRDFLPLSGLDSPNAKHLPDFAISFF